MKKIILCIAAVLMALFFFPLKSCAAQTEVSDLRWVLRNDGKPPFVRIVLDLTGKAKVEVALDKEGKNLEVILRDTTMANQPRDYQMEPSIISLTTTSQQGKDLYLDVALTNPQTMKDIKVFALKPDKKNKKPARLVIDIPRSTRISNAAPSADFYKIDPKAAAVLKGKVICIDPGHGGSDVGAIGQLKGKDIYEKAVTLSIALPLRDMLAAAGAKVIMTRDTDRDVYKPHGTDEEELGARVKVANDNKADIFLSIHIDSFSNPDIDGVTAYYYPKTNKDYLLAKSIHDANLNDLYIPDRGVRSNDFYVNVNSTMPSTLVEMGYMSNPSRLAMLTSKWAPKSIAKSVFNGLVAYFKQVEKS